MFDDAGTVAGTEAETASVQANTNATRENTNEVMANKSAKQQAQATTGANITAEKAETVATNENTISEGANAGATLENAGTTEVKTAAVNSDTVSQKGNTEAVAENTAVLKANKAAKFAAIAVIAALVYAYSKLSKVSEEVAAKAQDLNEEFSLEQKEISDYKKEVEKLKKIESDSSSSIEEITEARKSLMTIQNEIADKYGEEALSVDLLNVKLDEQTGTCKELTQAWKELAKSRWEAAKTDFNQGGFWNNLGNGLKGYKDNIDRMLDEYEDLTYSFDADSFTGTNFNNDIEDGLEKQVKSILKQHGFTIDNEGTGYASISITGTADEVYDAVDAIKEAIPNDSELYSDSLGGALSSILEQTKELKNEYEEFYKQYVLYEDILSETGETDGYVANYEQAINAHSKYQEAKISGDKKAIEEAEKEYAKAIIDARDSALEKCDSRVATYFEEMHPKLQDIVSGWDFKLDFEANTDSIHDDLADALSKLNSSDKVDELKQKYEELKLARQEAYSGSNYVGNVDINNRPVLINSDGSYSTTSTEFQEKWVGDKETGSYKILHYTPILPDGTVLEGDALNQYIDKILNSSNSLAADDPKNGGYGIVYKVDTEVNGEKITDGNLEDAFNQASAWDVKMHEQQDTIYADEAAALNAYNQAVEQQKYNVEELLNFNYAEATDEQRAGYDALTALAKTYNMELSDLVSLMNQLGLIDSMAYEELVGKFGQNLVDTLTPEDLEIGITIPKDAYNTWDEFLREIARKKAEAFTYKADDIFKLEDADGKLTDLGKLSEAIDEIQNAYKTLYDAIKEYNTNGKLSIDTLQSVIALGDDWLDYVDAETGALKLDKNALTDLTKARINDMRIQAINTIIDNVSNIKDDADATKYLASTNYEASKSFEALAEAEMKTAIAALEVQKNLGLLSQENYDAAVKKMESDIKKVNLLFDNTDFSHDSLYGGGEKTDYKQQLDDEINLLQKQLDAGKITFKQYLNDRKALIDKYYADGLIKAEDYYSELEEYYQAQIDIYDRILSAVERRFDKEIEKIQETIDGIEKQNEALELQLEQQDAILSVVEEVYDKQIESLEEQQELLDDQIKKLQDEADENQRLLDIEEARKNLAEARTRRSVFLYTEADGFIYTQNQEEIKQYEQELEDLEREQVIDELEKEKEALQESIDQLEEYKEAWLEIPNLREQAANRELAIALWGQDYEQVILANRTETLEAFKNNYISIQDQIEDNTKLIESYNEKIEYYEGLKEQWQEITEARQNALDDQLAAEMWGQDWEKIILENRGKVIEDFKNLYINAQNEMAAAAEEAARRIVAADKAAGVAGVGTGDGDLGDEDQSVSNQNSPDKIKQFISPGYDTRGEAESKINVYGGVGVTQNKDDGKWYVYKYIDNQKNSGGRTKDFSVKAYAKGGVITGDDESFLDPIAHALGEDHMVAVKEGERVLTPAQNFLWEKFNLSEASAKKFQSFTPDIQPFSGLKQKAVELNTRPVSVTYGDINITMNGVNDTQTFAKVLASHLPHMLK